MSSLERRRPFHAMQPASGRRTCRRAAGAPALAVILVALSFALPLLAATDISHLVGAPRGEPLTGATLEEATNETAALIRCPVCQGLSIADSPASMAVNMKAQVREFHATGYDREQIIQFFERSYGEFVRLEPPRRGINWLVWIAPLGALAIGATVLWFAMRAFRSRAPSAIPEPDADLEPYIERVRELAYGTKRDEVG